MPGNHKAAVYRCSPSPLPRGTIASQLSPPSNYPQGSYSYTPMSGAVMPYGMLNQPPPSPPPQSPYEFALRSLPHPPPSPQMTPLNSMDTIQLILAAQAQQNQEHREEMAREREANREFQRMEREANQAFQVSLLHAFLQSIAGSVPVPVAPALEPAPEPTPEASPEVDEGSTSPAHEETTLSPSNTEVVEQSTVGKRKSSDTREEEAEDDLPAKRARKMTPKVAAAQANAKSRSKK